MVGVLNSRRYVHDYEEMIWIPWFVQCNVVAHQNAKTGTKLDNSAAAVT